MLGANIAYLRKRNGLTQIEFAKRLHVTQSAVSHWESGRSMPDTTQLFNIAQLFGMTVDELSCESNEFAIPGKQFTVRHQDTESKPTDRRAEGKELLAQMTDEEYERALAMLRLLQGK